MGTHSVSCECSLFLPADSHAPTFAHTLTHFNPSFSPSLSHADSHAPTWAGNLDGHINLRDALLRTISYVAPNGKRTSTVSAVLLCTSCLLCHFCVCAAD